jgi:hypothetical protein
MPFNTARAGTTLGTAPYIESPNSYCQNDTTASDYGKCYNTAGKAVFVQTDTTTYPTLPCETDGTCTRYTATTNHRNLGTLFSFTGKQAIVQYIYSRSHSVLDIVGRITYLRDHPIPSTGDGAYTFLFPAHTYEQATWPIYDPVENWKAHLNPYTITKGRVFVLRWQGTLFTPVLYLTAYEANLNNIWYASDVVVVYAYESSPLAIIPLDYDKEWLPYQELRSAFGFSINGVDQPGWNADDIIRVLRELFPDRAWAVFDDRQYVLYLYNLTPDYVPDWLIEKLSPTAMKVLQSPADAAVAKAWLDLLNERNAQIPPQAELP